MNFLHRSFVQVSRIVSKDIGNVQQLRYLSDAKKKSDDAPIFDMENPFVQEPKQCVLCANNIELDYKNVRLLSQFVSPYTGRLYDKHITGLCETQQQVLKKEWLRAVKFGLMSAFYRDPQYADDPKLFDPTKPTRPNPY